MATEPANTGAPTRATVIPFPDTPFTAARRELNYCRNQRMFDRWLVRATKYRGLSEDERIAIGRYALARQLILASEGC